MQKRVKSFDGVKINYDIKRVSDNFLIFLHGVGGDLKAWGRERKFFHKMGLSTLAIDLRGHGLSGRPDLVITYDLESFAKVIYEVIKKERVSNFIIVGHCFGGVITIIFHKLYPKLAKGYILIDTTCKAPQALKRIFRYHPFFMNILNKILTNKDLHDKYFAHVNYDKFIGTSDWNFKRIYSDIVHTSLKSWIFTFENLADFKGISILKRINKPVLIIEGEKDSVFDVLVAKKIKNLIKNSRLHIIPKENHIIVINNPAVLEQEIFNFVKSINTFYKG